MTAKQDKLEYTIKAINSYTDPNDTIVDGNVTRPKRKTQVDLEPVADGAEGVFASVQVSAQPQAYRNAAPIGLTLTFVEVNGAFPWAVGETLTLSR